MNKELQKKIMRRVYYAYALRIVTNRIILHGFFMMALLIMLTYFVSIGNVLNNMMEIETSRLGMYFYHAVTNTEAWTLLLIGAFIMAFLSLRLSLSPKRILVAKSVPSRV